MSVARATLNSSLIMLFIKLVHRSIGVVSMLVLARLLTPEDFGIVAIASMVVFFCDILTETGTQQYVVNKNSIDDADLNTSFTLNIIFKFTIAVIFFVGSPVIATFFGKQELDLALKVIIFILPLSALANPGINLYKRNLNYKPIMKLLISEKVFSFFVTMCMAIVFRNYWAMISGVVASYIYKTSGTYVIHQFRPKLSLVKVHEQWSFSQWILLKGIVGYSKSEFDTFIVSKLFSFDAVGGFSLMKNLSTLPGREIIRPVTEPLLATFSKVKDSEVELRYQVQMSLGVLLAGTIPISTFLLCFSEIVVRTLFDERWWSFAPVLGVLSVLIVNFSIISVFQEALTAVGKVKFLFIYDLLSFVFVVVVLLLLKFDSIEQFAVSRMLISVLTIIPMVLVSFKTLSLSWKSFSQVFLLIVVSGVFSAFFASWVGGLVSQQMYIVQLAISGISFLLVYGILFYLFISLVPTNAIYAFRNFIFKTMKMAISMSSRNK